jgi:hypothetical protein
VKSGLKEYKVTVVAPAQITGTVYIYANNENEATSRAYSERSWEAGYTEVDYNGTEVVEIKEV